jgi:Dyp-type peroxidase family
MRRDVVNKTGSLAGVSELTVVAPIKRGFVPALDAVTYKTRVQRVLHTLHLGRTAAHEHELARVLSDAVERVGRIHSVSLRVLEPGDQVELAVVFDGAWEAYVRVIWQKVARLLDLIFCNTEGYRLGWESSYDDWAAWLKRSQSETSFLYATPGITVPDVRYLQMLERRHRREGGNPAEVQLAQLVIPTTEDIADLGIFGNDDEVGIDPTNAGFSTPIDPITAGRAPFIQGLRGLVGLHRLTEWHLPGTHDETVLLRAARELLPEFLQMIRAGNTYQTAIARGRERFDDAIEWFEQPDEALPAARVAPLRPEISEPTSRRNVQGGILEAYANTQHGGLLLLNFTSPEALSAFLLSLEVTSADQALAPGAITTNIAFTVQGLRAAGLPETVVRQFPDEFVQGMESRAGLLGDLRINHPRRWRLPVRNWKLGAAAPDAAEGDPGPRVEMAAVHAVLQLRLNAADAKAAAQKPARERLYAEMQRLVRAHSGVVPLSIQWMSRLDRFGAAVEHFGFADGKSNPVLKKSDAGRYYDENQVQLGEVLCGYPNRVDHVATPKDLTAREAHALMRDGSFLVVRKLRQDVEALESVLELATQPADAAVSRHELLAKMMGRWPADAGPDAGMPLAKVINPAKENDFTFDADPQGARCPLHAHIRRTNPRNNRPEAMSRPPRIVRRGMSYGPWHDRSEADPKRKQQSLAQERGSVFMAYNSSIGEQFEVVQRWVTGGNSAGSYSGQSDPFCGVAEPGRRRFFKFENGGEVCRVALDGSDALHAEPKPFVRLEWGAYLFAPSVRTLEMLQSRRPAIDEPACPAVAWDAEAGRVEIARLRTIESSQCPAAASLAWKEVLEDPQASADFKTAAVWASIRKHHGGVLRTPFGILVGSAALVDEVLVDAQGHLSAHGYLPRMQRSFGKIYLGFDAQDPADDYQKESLACNQAIMVLPVDDAFTSARASTKRTLDVLVQRAQIEAQEDGQPAWDLTVEARELIDPMIADMCEKWFGVNTDGGHFTRGGYRWDWRPDQPPTYPGHLLAPSRYFFQPNPLAEVESFGEAHGQALLAAMTAFLHAFANSLNAPVARAVLDAGLDKGDFDFSARTLIGGLMGFVPTTDGNLRRVLNEWLREGTFWSLRARYAGEPSANLDVARSRLGRDLMTAMQVRTAPDLLWRTAKVQHRLGKVGPHQVVVQPGEKVVAGLSSVTQQRLEEQARGAAAAEGDSLWGLEVAFGGDRWKRAPRPTHACPGSHAAMAVMLGFFSALVESALTLRTGPGPLTLSLDGRFGPADVPPTVEADRPRVPPGSVRNTDHAPRKPKEPVTTYLGVGDSWLAPQYGRLSPNLCKPLADRRFVQAKFFGAPGALLQQLASAEILDNVVYYLNHVDPAEAPQVLLLSAGGNDVVYPTSAPKKSPLFQMLLQNPAAGADPLIESEVKTFVDEELFGHYCRIIDAVVASSTMPIVIHEYDHPRPDGRRAAPLIGPWLQPVFQLRGIGNAGVGEDPRARDVMRRSIDRLDAVVSRLERKYPGRVLHASLCGTLAREAGYEEDYKLFWANELHATERGFGLLADVIAKKLRQPAAAGLRSAGRPVPHATACPASAASFPRQQPRS